MKQSVKLGLILVIVALLAASGIAIAQTDGEDADPTPATETQSSETPSAVAESSDGDGAAGFQEFDGFRGELARHGHPGFAGLIRGIDGVAEVLGMDRAELFAALADGSTLVEVASDQGVDEATLISELEVLASDAVSQALSDGLIDQARADEILAGLDERLSEMVNRAFEGKRHHRHHPVARGFIGDEVSEILGLTKAEIHEKIEAGQTMAEIATEQGVEPEDLIDGVTEEFRNRFSDRVYGADEGN